MTELHSEAQEGAFNLDSVESLDMADLRRMAKILGITSQRDWKKEDYVKALKDQRSKDVPLAQTQGSGPQPGYARVLVHRDPTPGHANKPLHVAVNGHIFGVPRGVEVDVPIPHIEALANAIVLESRQVSNPDRNHPEGRYREEPKTSYPFQVIAITPGEYRNPHDNRIHTSKIREEFNRKFGKWPTAGELAEYRKEQHNKANK